MRPETIIMCAFAALLPGCDDDAALRGPRKQGGEGGGETTTTAPAPTVARSDKALVRFKRDVRLRNDFSEALALDPEDLCLELGQYDCVGEVHGVALGGLRPYDLGINEPATDTGVTAPMVVERIALAGCGLRVERDLNGKSPVIFEDLPIDAEGALIDKDAPQVAAAITTLYRRALLRDPKPSEVAHYLALYDDIAADSSAPARDWAVLSCFVVLTSTESLFY